jgi:hypothetical protein
MPLGVVRMWCADLLAGVCDCHRSASQWWTNEHRISDDQYYGHLVYDSDFTRSLVPFVYDCTDSTGFDCQTKQAAGVLTLLRGLISIACALALTVKMTLIGLATSGIIASLAVYGHFALWMTHVAALQQAALTYTVLVWPLGAHIMLLYNAYASNSILISASWIMTFVSWMLSAVSIVYLRHVITHRRSGAPIIIRQQVHPEAPAVVPAHVRPLQDGIAPVQMQPMGMYPHADAGLHLDPLLAERASPAGDSVLRQRHSQLEAAYEYAAYAEDALLMAIAHKYAAGGAPSASTSVSAR